MSWLTALAGLPRRLLTFPWRSTAHTLGERFRADRLGLTAGSLAFTSIIALVPLLALVLAVFSAFPMFAKMQDGLQRWLVESLVPDSIARQVLGYLTQFARHARRLGTAGAVALVLTALALLMTIDRTLNTIWRVRRARPLGRRLLVYWAGLTIGPLLLAVSVALTSYVISASRGLATGLPGGTALLIDALQFAMLAAGAAAMYHYVPNTVVRWSHAWCGGLFVAVGIELARRLLALYLAQVPTYSVVYGAFATVPILLVWTYLAWVIVLLGAVIAAYLPSLLAGVPRRDLGNGWRFQLALEVLQALHAARAQPGRGLDVHRLAEGCRVSHLGIESVLEALVRLDWVARIAPAEGEGEPRYVLLADPASTRLEPLAHALLLHRDASTERLWAGMRLGTIRLSEVL